MKSDTSLFKGIIAKTLVDELKSEFIGCQYYFPQKGKKNICLTVVEVKGNLFCMYLFGTQELSFAMTIFQELHKEKSNTKKKTKKHDITSRS